MLCAIVALLFILTACDQNDKKNIGPQYSSKANSSESVYYLAVHPLNNPDKLLRSYQPLIDYLNENISGIRFELEASRDYQVYEAKYRRKEAEFLLPNPWQTLQAIKVGYHVIAQAGDANDFKGILIKRKDSKIATFNDLKGKTLSYPSATALAACILPQYFLSTKGIDVVHDIKNKYVGSQESAIMHTYLKQSDIGVTWPPPWRDFQKNHPEVAKQLTVIWETQPLINNSLMARNDIPEEIQLKVKNLLLNLGESIEGREILANMETTGFYAADNSTYNVVETFINSFEKSVRKVKP
ncbi:MAG: PhnD/SsuA/transferrin family substrate-binding protein [Gammaproteobacteria bacterium]|nr:PhnD/SsuA/transferrin family substrate-binding protein [Gammaproteobacteria bacterium]